MIKLKFRYYNSLERTNNSSTHEEIKLSCTFLIIKFNNELIQGILAQV